MSQSNHRAGQFTNCDREPIHLCGSIQPHGYLFAVEPSTEGIKLISSNVTDLLNLPKNEIVGRRFSEIAVSPVLRANALRYSTDVFDVYELEKVAEYSHKKNQLFKTEIDRLASTSGLDSLYQALATSVRALTEFERVMVYRFNADWSGTVVGETVTHDYESFLHLRFPAEDIPIQARALYTQNSLRYIPDVQYQSVPLISANENIDLDLSKSFLRGVSDVHLEYLRNMDVGASMSISIFANGKLWGLVACHNRTAHAVDPAIRGLCESLCAVAAQFIETRTESAQFKRDSDKRLLQLNLIDKLSHFNDVMDGLKKHGHDLLELVGAKGAVVAHESAFDRSGGVPDGATIEIIIEQLKNSDLPANQLLATDELRAWSAKAPESTSERASGMLAMALNSSRSSWLLWLRPELLSEVHWAGEPTKLTDIEAQTLHPRRSFKNWKETVRGKCYPWTEEEVRAAQALGSYVRQRLDSEARFESAINAVAQAMLVVDQDGKIRRANEAAAGLFEDLPRLQPGEAVTCFLPNGIETKHLQSTNSARPQKSIEVTSSPLETAEGLFALVSIADVSAKVESEREKARLTAALSDSNEKMEQFLDTIAHDLKAPLLSASNLVQWIEDDAGELMEGQTKENLVTLKQRMKSMREQVTALLDYSKAGNMRSTPEEVDTTKLVAEIARAILPMQRYNLVVKELPVFSTVKAPLEHVLHNLLDNAAKYGGEPGGDIIVSAVGQDDFFKFSIEDHGIGVPSEYQQEIFLPLRKLAKSGNESHGMGLAFVRRIVEQSGGEVSLTSLPGQGSTFSFTWKKVWS